jgi:uncharacterized SAM-binding protein YcdF (DUF218 family)
MAEADRREKAMREAMTEVASALRTLRQQDPWAPSTKVTDDFLDPLFKKYFEKLGLPNQMLKTNYHMLAHLVPAERIDSEVAAKLDSIAQVAARAKPRKE